ncbi:acetyl-CoA hydrolase/transferase C-terminal domain-containing protein [Desulfonema ishimotonii]|uniref:acetyl-CoA hydrolase/transferase C-terminal domain-containing protein n=1 Tax=Desulfonema ishimotonii TaxID=45657 RepID=UPI001AA01663|nr:acetyl-CoA hydrolase/transferase C-terminal domain-containing protein [Desulfonema ishimotonii]
MDDVIEHVGKNIVLALPLGLGKANQTVNALFRRAQEDPGMVLKILTAITLERPAGKTDLEQRFLEPFVARLFGNYPDLSYAQALRNGDLPPNVEVIEFFHRTAAYLSVPVAQQNYISANYTHIARDMMARGVNVIAQLFCDARSGGKTLYSLSSNPDVTLDGVRMMREKERAGKKIAIIGQKNPNLPFMYGDAVVGPDFFDAVVDQPDYYFDLFAPPKMSVSTEDYLIGLNASTLIRDGGTLQIGIGSLGDAITCGLQLRHTENAVYREILTALRIPDRFGPHIREIGGTGGFEKGLYGATEMLVDGYISLYRSGIIRRKVYDDEILQQLLNEGQIGEQITARHLDILIESGAVRPVLTGADVLYLRRFGFIRENWYIEDGFMTDGALRVSADLTDPENRNEFCRHCLGTDLKTGTLIHAGFFLGPNQFYEALRDMSEAERKQINMTSVQHVNQLYGCPYASQRLKTLQRRHGRFVNAALMVTLSGAVISDGLENGEVISGVGGQYNFVSMAHALPDARSVIMVRSTRPKGREIHSNILWNYGHTTIPRHLKDVVVTEYGIADLRAKTDREVIAALLNITDSRFQDELLREARRAKKLPRDYRIPDAFRENLPGRSEAILAPFREKGFFPAFPYGTDFTHEELVLAKALKGLKEEMSGKAIPIPRLGSAIKSMGTPDAARPYLERMKLDNPITARESMMQRLVVYALVSGGHI